MEVRVMGRRYMIYIYICISPEAKTDPDFKDITSFKKETAYLSACNPGFHK